MLPLSEDALAPNGLPYPSDPTERVAMPLRASLNQWARRSTVLSHLPDDAVKSTHPFVVAQRRTGVHGGMGLFVYMGIKEGEVVWAERADTGSTTNATPRSRAWIEALPADARRAYCHYMCARVPARARPSWRRATLSGARPRPDPTE
jgi:hypothetical protein